MKELDLTQERLKALLDYDSETGVFRWRVQNKSNRKTVIAGCRAQSEHWSINIEGRRYRAHQLAWLYMKGEWGRPLIDHRDGNPLNNRWDNLRLGSHGDNAANRSRLRTNRSGFKGVCFDPRRGKWRAQITKDGRRFSIGSYATAEEAHAAYVAKARELFGEFARAE